MKIRTQQEIQSLDAELNLFDEDKWDFMGVIDNQDVNYEYFNDIRDTDFLQQPKVNYIKEYSPIVAMFAVVITCGFLVLNSVGFFNNEQQKYEMLATSNQGVYIERIKGESGTSNDLIEVSSVLSNYFGTMTSKTGYENLDTICLDGSNFNKTYYDYTNKIVTLYDPNDCRARLMREFSSLCSVVRVNDIIVKDDVYYCYVTLTLPTDSAVHEYTYLNSYDFTQRFNNSQVSESLLMQYYLELLGKTKFTTGVAEYCIEMKRNSLGSLMISDDSFMTEICLSAYNKTLTNITNILGSNLNN